MNTVAARVLAQPSIGNSGLPSAGKSAEIFSLFSSAYERERRECISLTAYLAGCRDNPGMYATAAERMVAAIGEPKMIDTSTDLRLGRIFLNRTIKVYPTLAGFFGMEETIQRVVSYFHHAAQGLEERKQILYLLGPVGGGKSSLAERLKQLMESQPIYVLAAGDEISPIFESPLGLFQPETMGAFLESEYGKKYAFGLKPAESTRTYVLVADSEHSRLEWLEFCCLMGAQRPKDAFIKQQIKAGVGVDKDEDD